MNLVVQHAGIQQGLPHVWPECIMATLVFGRVTFTQLQTESYGLTAWYWPRRWQVTAHGEAAGVVVAGCTTVTALPPLLEDAVKAAMTETVAAPMAPGVRLLPRPCAKSTTA